MKSEKHPYSCNTCKKTFSVAIFLVQHVESQHGNHPEKPLVKIEARETIDTVTLDDTNESKNQSKTIGTRKDPKDHDINNSVIARGVKNKMVEENKLILEIKISGEKSTPKNELIINQNETQENPNSETNAVTRSKDKQILNPIKVHTVLTTSVLTKPSV